MIKRLDIGTERKIRDLIKSNQGNEVILERQGASFTFKMDANSADVWQTRPPKKTVKASSRGMEVDEVAIVKSYSDSFWEDPEYSKLRCGPCE